MIHYFDNLQDIQTIHVTQLNTLSTQCLKKTEAQI